MNEHTIIRTVPLLPGRRAELFADANVIGIAPGLTDAEREEAIDELQAEWRRNVLRIIPRGATLGVAVAAAAVAVMEMLPVAAAHAGI